MSVLIGVIEAFVVAAVLGCVSILSHGLLSI